MTATAPDRMWRSQSLARDIEPFITRLCKVHAENGGFAVPETREIGAEIYLKHGHDGVVAVYEAIDDLLGADSIDLEYGWAGIAWYVLLPRLRELLDMKGLQQIAVVDVDDVPYLGNEQFDELIAGRDPFEVGLFSFRPYDPDWRFYDLEGGYFEGWLRKAKASDYLGIPMISLSANGKWEIRFGYAQGLLPAEVFDDEQTFLDTLLDYLVRHFPSRVYTLESGG